MKNVNKYHNPSLEEIYSKLDKQFLLAEKYCNIPGLSFIFKSCRLIPVKYYLKRSSNIVLYKDYKCEHNFTLHITENKQIKIYNGITDFNICTDLYFGLPLKDIIKISKLAYIQYGNDDVSLNQIAVISLLGIDNYFRTYVFDNEWKQTSTLIIGMNNLKKVYKSLDILAPTDMIESSIPMSGSKQFLTPLPLDINIQQKLKIECNLFDNLF